MNDASREQGQYNVPPTPDEFQGMSVSASESGIQSVPLEELKHMWTKAQNLLSASDSVVACPGNKHGFVVASAQDPSKPHVVIPLASGEVKCCGCPQYDRISICSHCVAVTERKSILRKFLAWYTKKKENPNFSLTFHRLESIRKFSRFRPSANCAAE